MGSDLGNVRISSEGWFDLKGERHTHNTGKPSPYGVTRIPVLYDCKFGELWLRTIDTTPLGLQPDCHLKPQLTTNELSSGPEIYFVQVALGSLIENLVIALARFSDPLKNSLIELGPRTDAVIPGLNIRKRG